MGRVFFKDSVYAFGPLAPVWVVVAARDSFVRKILNVPPDVSRVH